MNVTLWILAVFFGGFATITTMKYLFGPGVDKFESVMLFIAVIIAAHAIGMLIGGVESFIPVVELP